VKTAGSASGDGSADESETEEPEGVAAGGAAR